MKKIHTISNYEDLYTDDKSIVDRNREEWIEVVRNAGIKGYRWKVIRSGDFLEVEINPHWKKSVASREKDIIATKLPQQIVNKRNRIKHITRLMNTNFRDGVHISFTYSQENLPASEEAAKKEIEKYLRRLRNHAKKQGLELKYILVTETQTEEGVPVRFHHHLVTNFMDRDKAESLWKGGGFINADRLQSNENGFEALAEYILKQKKSAKYKKSYSCSRNLEKYKVSTNDSKITKTRAMKLFREELDPREFFEKEFKNYTFTSMVGKVSDFIDGCYLHVKMRKFSSVEKKTKRKKKVEVINVKEAAEEEMQLVVSYRTKGKVKSAVGIVTVPKGVDLLTLCGKWYVRKLDEKLANVIVNEIPIQKAKLILEKLGREDLRLKYFSNKEKE